MRVLKQFPLVRGRDYVAGSLSPANFESINRQQLDWLQIQGGEKCPPSTEPESLEEDKVDQTSLVENFWEVLENRAAEKIGKESAVLFTDAFKKCHMQMVNDVLSLDDIGRIVCVPKYQQMVRQLHRRQNESGS